MKILDTPQELNNIFGKYNELHKSGHIMNAFLVQYVLFEISSDESIDYTQINRQALERIAEYEAYPFEETYGAPTQQNRFVITYKAGIMTSQPITSEQFLGPHYDLAKQQLIREGSDGRFYNADTPEKPEYRVDLPKREVDIANGKDLYAGFVARGYASAFTSPVHDLQLTEQEIAMFFGDVNKVLFGSFQDDLEIKQWSIDWSSYFVAGQEWWGAYWWTIHNKTKNQVIVVAASGTD